MSLPTLPQVFIDTSVAPLITGLDRVVHAGGDLQGALNAAQLGDSITLDAGAVFTGPFTLPNKASGSGWITVRTSLYANLPNPGTRVAPVDAAKMATIRTPDTRGALLAATGAHHYWFIGIEVTGIGPLAAGNQNSGLIVLDADALGTGPPQTTAAQVPHHLTFDRCYIHAPGDFGDFIRGFVCNSATTAVVDSYVSGFKATGRDTQAIAGWNGPGPFKIVNNYLEGAGENILFGGALALIPNLVPSDIEIRLNTFDKPISWNPNDPSYAGTTWSVKNLLEFKNAQRVLIEGNWFTHHWSGAQSGFFMEFTPGASDSGAWAVASDLTVRYNRSQHTTAGWRVGGQDTGNQTIFSARVAIQHNLAEDLGAYPQGGGFPGLMLMAGNGIIDLTFDHGTVVNTFGVLTMINQAAGPLTRLTLTNTIAHGGGFIVVGDGVGFGVPALNGYAPGSTWVFTHNVLWGPYPNDQGVTPSDSFVPVAGSFFPQAEADVVFVDAANGNYALGPLSPYRAQATDGKDIGVDMVALAAAFAKGNNAYTSVPGTVTLLPSRLDGASTLRTPTMFNTLPGPQARSQATLLTPTVLSAYVAQPAILSNGASLRTPVVTLTPPLPPPPQTVTPARVTATAALVTPAIQTVRIVSPTRLIATSLARTPASVKRVKLVAIRPTILSAVAAVLSPTIGEPIQVSPLLVTGTAALIVPAVGALSTVTVAPTTLDVPGSLRGVTLHQTLAPDLLDAPTGLLDPLEALGDLRIAFGPGDIL